MITASTVAPTMPIRMAPLTGHQRQVGCVAAAEEVAGGVPLRPDDQRVEHDDVGHREEGDQPAAHLAAERRAPLGDLEVAVEWRRRRQARAGLLSHG